MTAPKALTRKVGPAPLWAWLVVALVGAYIVVRHRNASPAQATAVPVTADTAGYASGATGSTASPDSGGASDLLSALTGNTDALTALQSALGGGGYGQAGGGGAGATGSGSNTAAVTAPTVDSGTNNAPAPVTQANAYDPAQAAAAAALGVSAQPNMTLDQLNAQLADQGQPTQSYPSVIQPATVTTIGGPSQVAPPVASPTPTLVQPAPVDTSHVVSGGGGGRVPLAV